MLLKWTTLGSDTTIWATAFLSVCLAAATPAVAGKFKILYNFCAQASCADGSGPTGPLLLDTAGDIFGMTNGGGNSANAGVIFEMTPSGGGGYNYEVLYTFCQQTNCADGKFPYGSLIMDTSGDLYGVTGYAGANDGGEVFELLPGNGNWNFQVLYSFCAQSNCNDGNRPTAGLTYAGAASGALYDGSSTLYGPVELGAGGSGGAYSLQPSTQGWNEQVIYAVGEASPLIMDSSGNLYGTGSSEYIAFELSPSNDGWVETTLDDRLPYPDGLVMDPSSTLWGLTLEGGGHCHLKGFAGNGCGSIYSLTPGKKGYSENVWHAFCAEHRCPDGALPYSAPVLDAQGNLFGTATEGGSFKNYYLGGGTLFELRASGEFAILHIFCKHESCTDGLYPNVGATIDSSGNLYGTTWFGGNNDGGIVYEYTH